MQNGCGTDDDAEAMLTLWGDWLRFCGGVIPGYVSPALALVRAHTGTVVGEATPAIDDSTAIWVDQLVARLGQQSPMQKRALICYFSWQMSYRQVAAHLRCSKTRAEEAVKYGIAFVAGALSSQSA